MARRETGSARVWAESQALRDYGWSLSHCPPPYVEVMPLPAAPRQPTSYSLLILDVSGAVVDRADLEYGIRSLRCHFAMPVFVRSEVESNLTKRGLRRAVIAAGGEILPSGDQIGTRAAYVLTQRRDLASGWIGWVCLRRRLAARPEGVIRVLLNHPQGFCSSTDVLRAAGIADRSARRWLAVSNLPAASTWFHAGRILRALLWLQRDAKLTVRETARQLGYSSADTFSNQLFRYFGHSAKRGRTLLGLEPRFHAFDTRIFRTRP